MKVTAAASISAITTTYNVYGHFGRFLHSLWSATAAEIRSCANLEVRIGAALALMNWLKRASDALNLFGFCGFLCFRLLVFFASLVFCGGVFGVGIFSVRFSLSIVDIVIADFRCRVQRISAGFGDPSIRRIGRSGIQILDFVSEHSSLC